MLKNYWTLFYLSLIGAVVFLCLFTLGFIFMKKVFLVKKNGLILLVASSVASLFLVIICVNMFIRCCKDYHYVVNNTYLEEKAQVVEFTHSRRDYDGNGQIIYRKPKFYLIDRDEYIVLNVKDVEVGETYIIRYYPNTKICDVIGKAQQ